MTAPAAPTINTNQDGHVLYVRWRPVVGGATYNLYVAEVPDAAAVIATVAAAAQDANGWFFKIVGPYAGVVNVYVTAVNAGAEESVASNVVQKNLTGGTSIDHKGKPKGLR